MSPPARRHSSKPKTLYPRVLILERDTTPTEGAGAIEQSLRRRRIAYHKLPLSALQSGQIVTHYRIKSDAELQLEFVLPGRTCISTRDLRSVWAEDIRVSENPMLDPGPLNDFAGFTRKIGESENWLLCNYLFALLSMRCLFLPHGAERLSARHRLYQLAIARSSGFRIPDTYVGKHGDAMSRALKFGHGRPIHFQPFEPNVIEIHGKRFASVSRFVDADRHFALANIRIPSLFSRWPAVGARYLVAVVGSKLFALQARVRKNAGSPDVTDLFYQHAQGDLDLMPTRLDARAARLCARFMSRAQLQYCLLDFFAVKGSRDYLFFEAHPDGRLPLFAEAGLPVYDALAEWLGRGKEA